MQSWHEDARFRVIKTVADYRDMAVAWLRGEIADLPSNCGPPNAETAEINADLVAMNLGGLLTMGSQPATDRQRAHVDGFARFDVAAALWLACNASDLIAIITEPRPIDEEGELPFGIPVTVHRGATKDLGGGYIVDDGEPTTFAGRGGSDVVYLRDAGVDPGELAEYVHIDMIDPTWGRTDVLVPTILGVLKGA
jgi:hypothetical protein